MDTACTTLVVVCGTVELGAQGGLMCDTAIFWRGRLRNFF